MIGGHQWGTPNDQIAHGSVHWNNNTNSTDHVIEGNAGSQ
jgi:hypothetical protein